MVVCMVSRISRRPRAAHHGLMNTISPELSNRRMAIVNEHIAAEAAHDVERTLKTFHTAHYWVRPLGAETAGSPAVAELLGMLFNAFPDFEFTPVRTYQAADAVIIEGKMTGTHRGPWAGVPASGNTMNVMGCCIFHFQDDRLMSESVYFDHATLLAQIGVK
jgi:steroid delta-isomerase-like uncharacterized protein